jgi:hypothetical protein
LQKLFFSTIFTYGEVRSFSNLNFSLFLGECNLWVIELLGRKKKGILFSKNEEKSEKRFVIKKRKKDEKM